MGGVGPTSPRIPLWVKLAFTAFMAVMVPTYLTRYGLLNFLWFCDIAMLLTLVVLWREDRLVLSIVSTGILLPQALWLVDFAVEATGHTMLGLTSYMFRSEDPLFPRFLSLFHGWLPLLLVYLLGRVGYDPRGWPIWSCIAAGACGLSYWLIPGPCVEPLPVKNVNMVYGPSETVAQTFLPPLVYLVLWIAFLICFVYYPSHRLLKAYYREHRVPV